MGERVQDGRSAWANGACFLTASDEQVWQRQREGEKEKARGRLLDGQERVKKKE